MSESIFEFATYLIQRHTKAPILQDHDIDQVKKRAAHVVYFPSLTYLALKLWLKKERRANTTSHVSRKAPDGEDRLRSSLSPNKPKGSSQATAVDFIGDPKLFVIKKELEFLLSELVKKIIAINKRFDESYENINRVNQEFNNSPQALKGV